MRYRMVIWDFDGTLADTSRDVWESLMWAAERCGAALPEDFMSDDANLGKSVHDIFRHLIPFPGERLFPAYGEDVRVHYRALNDFPSTSLYPGMLQLLGTLRRNRIRNVIVTNKPRQALERLLIAKGWVNLFDDWITPDWWGDRDPMSKATMFARVIERYGMSVNECVTVGDTWGDAAAARSVGIDCIAVTYGDGDAALMAAQSPEYMVDDVESVANVLLGRSPANSTTYERSA